MSWLLLAVLVLPALGAVVAAALPWRLHQAAKLTGVAVSGLAFLASLGLLVARSGPWFSYTPKSVIRPWVELDLEWVPGLDLGFHLGVDGISWPLVALTTLLTLLCCLYTLWYEPHCGGGKNLVALLLIIEVGIVGVFLALDLVLFFVFFEIVLLPMYAVIAVWGGPGRQAAARKFVLYTLFGSVLLLVGVFTVVAAAGTADLVELSGAGGAGIGRGVQIAAFVLLALAFAVKSPLWPLHTWLPDAHTEAPTVGSVILAGVLLKMGTYGLIRVVAVVPEGAQALAPVLGILAVAAILIGSLVCLAQTELKRLIAYSSVGHMGFVLLGIATLTATGFQAALIGNIAHGVITGLLFFLAGAIKDRFGTGDLTELGGLRERMPLLAGILGFAAIASLGLPGLAGFWGEAFAVYAAIAHGGGLWLTLGVLAAVGGAVTAAYFLRLLRRVTHGSASPAVETAECGPVAAGELVAWGPLVVLALAIGLIPGLVLWLSAGPVDALMQVVVR
ncbi:MAG: complex I subunit 4 family protein [Micromonosporaceae bacterium]